MVVDLEFRCPFYSSASVHSQFHGYFLHQLQYLEGVIYFRATGTCGGITNSGVLNMNPFAIALNSLNTTSIYLHCLLMSTRNQFARAAQPTSQTLVFNSVADQKFKYYLSTGKTGRNLYMASFWICSISPYNELGITLSPVYASFQCTRTSSAVARTIILCHFTLYLWICFSW